jgi:uncharacterized repeat protein (TIGR03809 family)
MTHRLDVARGRDIVGRWCALAEQRLDHLTELFETGRWRRYHSERAFLENVQEAKAAVELWRDLLAQEDSRDHSAIDISWLGRPRSTGSRGGKLPDQAAVIQLRPAPVPAELPPSAMSVDVKTIHVPSGEVASAPESSVVVLDIAPQLTSDIPAMHERYPLLRNAL